VTDAVQILTEECEMQEFRTYPGADLLRFVEHDMQMSAIYQPLIIMELIRAGGRLPAAVLAQSLLLEDQFQVQKARDTLMRWPYITLKKREKVFYDKSTREFVMPVDFASEDQKAAVLGRCEAAVTEWRRKQRPRASIASLRYRLIERAHGRCQACGSTGQFGQLDIDHIVPREKADRDNYVTLNGERMHVHDERNLQVLCPTCNRGKRSNSTYDFRPSPERLAQSVANVLRLAASEGHDATGIYRLGLRLFESDPEMPTE
jgi:5-methylcytosine-specific restriction endonuclease McrA